MDRLLKEAQEKLRDYKQKMEYKLREKDTVNHELRT
jgi:hypothetical protein